LPARLPTNAEWEYACRAGTTTPFSFGAKVTPDVVNYNGNYPYAGGEKGVYRQKTVPAASLQANPWGLYEMHGNIYEWCADWYADYPTEPQIDPQGPQTGVDRVLRGGSWGDVGRLVRSAYRSKRGPGLRAHFIGFRLALDQDEQGLSSADPVSVPPAGTAAGDAKAATAGID
jgi:formylglycine-generating enzyme required for sulfatase activity